MLLLVTLIQIIEVLRNVLFGLILVQFVIGMLLTFNIVKRGNDFTMTVYNAINALLDPVLRPIRRVLPATGGMDFSPLVLIILFEIALIVLNNLALAAV